MPEQNAVGMQLVQEIAIVALAISDNFLPKIFNNWLCEMSDRGNGQQTSQKIMVRNHPYWKSLHGWLYV